jgi:hypothetical protein
MTTGPRADRVRPVRAGRYVLARAIRHDIASTAIGWHPHGIVTALRV